MAKEKLYKITKFHEEGDIICQSETVIFAKSKKNAMEQALKENDIHIEEVHKNTEK